MKYRDMVKVGFSAIALMMVVGVIFSGFGYQPRVQAQQSGPTATPDTIEWLAFSAARDALSEEIQRQITWVKQYTYDGDANFEDGMTDCRTLEEGESPQEVFFGWRFVITLLNNEQYEVRVSYNREITVVCDEVTVEVAAPSTGSDLGAPGVAPLGPGGLEVGAQFQVWDTPSSTYQLAKDSGMTWVKKQVKPENYGAAAGYIQQAHANGMKIMLSVTGDHHTVTTEAGQNAYAAKVAEFAAAGADAIEIWNEANLDREWPQGQISGASYAQLLKKSYNAIKAARPATMVILGAPAPTGAAGAQTACSQNANFCNDDVWYREVAAAGGGQFMDCVGVHYNEGVISPRQSSGDPRGGYPTYYYGSNLARALGPFPGKQACFTEIGYLTPEGYGDIPGTFFDWAQNTTVAQQAQWLGEAVDLAQAQGNVRLFIVFNMDLNTVWGSDPQAGYAIIRQNGNCPACTAIKNALSN